MPKVTAWKCPHTGRLFDESDHDKYVKHLRKLARQRQQERKIQKARDDWDAFVVRMGQTVKSFDELSKFIEDNWSVFAAKLAGDTWTNSKKWLGSEVKICIHQMRRDELCRNTHEAPRGKPTNWKRDPALPSGYPGWHGRINIRVKGEGPGFMSHVFEQAGINTGTGGGGGKDRDGFCNLSYELTLFDDDFPAIAHEYHKGQNWKALGGKFYDKSTDATV